MWWWWYEKRERDREEEESGTNLMREGRREHDGRKGGEGRRRGFKAFEGELVQSICNDERRNKVSNLLFLIDSQQV